MQTRGVWNKESYRRYLESDNWKRQRAKRCKLAVWLKRRFVCEWCMTPQRLANWDEPRRLLEDIEININVHQISYDRIGEEKFLDLMVVCRDCQGLLHDYINKIAKNGRSRRDVMQRLEPYCVRRIQRTHKIYNSRYYPETLGDK